MLAEGQELICEEDRKEIEFLKRKILIEDFFKREQSKQRRNLVYKKLLLHYHPDKNKSIDINVAKSVFLFLQDKKN